MFYFIKYASNKIGKQHFNAIHMCCTKIYIFTSIYLEMQKIILNAVNYFNYFCLSVVLLVITIFIKNKQVLKKI